MEWLTIFCVAVYSGVLWVALELRTLRGNFVLQRCHPNSVFCRPTQTWIFLKTLFFLEVWVHAMKHSPLYKSRVFCPGDGFSRMDGPANGNLGFEGNGSWMTSECCPCPPGNLPRMHQKIQVGQKSKPNMTRRRFHRTTEAIPRRPWKAKSPSLPDY